MKYRAMVCRVYEDVDEVEADTPEQAIRLIMNEEGKTVLHEPDSSLRYIIDKEVILLRDATNYHDPADTYILENGVWIKFKPKAIPCPE